MDPVKFVGFFPDRHSPRGRLWATFRLDRVRRAAAPAKGLWKSIGLPPALRNRLPALALWRNPDVACLRPAPLQVTSRVLPSLLEFYAR